MARQAGKRQNPLRTSFEKAAFPWTGNHDQ
jgi:hypothetical protein